MARRVTHAAASTTVCVTAGLLAATVATGQPKGQPNAKPKIADRVYVRMTTTLGDMIIELDQHKAPITVKNFLSYVDDGFYEGTLFHRVIKNFMIQGGGMLPDYTKKPTKPPIKNEADNGLKNVYGSIAMARTGDPHSATSQFFINVKANSMLDHRSPDPAGWGYCVFGKVVQGLDVVQRIRNTPVKKDPRADAGQAAAPITPVIIKKVTRLDPQEAQKLLGGARAADATDRQKHAAEMTAQRETAKTFLKGRGVDVSLGKLNLDGFWFLDVKEGSGAWPKPNDTVKVHYTGWLVNGKKFDASVDRGKPETFKLGKTIKGFNNGIRTMKTGGKRYLIIPGDLAYGVKGNPGADIPPNATLIFEVELLEVSKPK